MQKFRYTGRDAAGATSSGTLEAADRRQAIQRLRLKKITLTTLEEVRAHAPGQDVDLERLKSKFRDFFGVTQSQKSRFNSSLSLPFLRALSGLVTSGIQVADGIRLLSKRLNDPQLRALCVALWDELSQGQPLSAAMRSHPAVFEESTINLIEAGEATGKLDAVLVRVLSDMEERKEVRSRLLTAMAYPAFIVLMTFGVILIFLFFLLPRIQQLLSTLRGSLPWPTQVLIAFADFLVKYGPFLLVALVIAGFVILAWRKKPHGRAQSDAFLLRLPGIRAFVLSNEVLRLSQALSLLLENGISTIPALAMTERTLQNRVVRSAFSEARARIAEGMAISNSLKQTGFFPDLVIDIMTVGENAGNIVPSLKEVSRIYRQQLSKQISAFTSIVSVGVLFVAFAFVALVAFGIISCVFQLSSSLQAR